MNMSKLIVELEKKDSPEVATNFTAGLREEGNEVIPGIVGALADKYGFDVEEAMGILGHSQDKLKWNVAHPTTTTMTTDKSSNMNVQKHLQSIVDAKDTEEEQKNIIMEAQNKDLKQLEKYISKYYPNIKDSHYTTLIDILYVTAVRNYITIPNLIKDLYNGILDKDVIYKLNSGNIYDLLKNPTYKLIAERIKDITVGSNGGMANIGKGEHLLSFGCGINPETDKPYVNIIKNGNGDIRYNVEGVNEEVKWNGGKVDVGQVGKDVTRKFNSLAKIKDIKIKDNKYVPFRTKKDKHLTEEQRETYNALYWQAISEEEIVRLTNNELKQKIINMSFSKIFEKSDSLIMFNDDGKFHRFRNLEQANAYYSDKLEELKGTSKGFECRADQSNPIALYCYVF